MPEATPPLGSRIRRLRKRKKLTLFKLAVLSGLSPTFISDLERGSQRNITLTTLLKMAEALDVKPETLIKGLTLEQVEPVTS